MANAQPGDQESNNPGQGKPGMNLLKEQAQSIKEQLQQLIEQMKNGNPQNMNQQLGQSLMQHEMMQQMLRELMNSGGVGSPAHPCSAAVCGTLRSVICQRIMVGGSGTGLVSSATARRSLAG